VITGNNDVGLIAVMRTILIFDFEKVDPISGVAVAAPILSLAARYYLVTRDQTNSKLTRLIMGVVAYNP
jgi:uncharacterized membrane protein (DUF373 family)